MAKRYVPKRKVIRPDRSVTVTIDKERCLAIWSERHDPNKGQFYQPPIVGRTIVR